jgi:hypothetical protein
MTLAAPGEPLAGQGHEWRLAMGRGGTAASPILTRLTAGSPGAAAQTTVEPRIAGVALEAALP